MSSSSASPKENWTYQIEPNGRFPPEKGRYLLYVGLFCPFAHRALIMRKLKGLEDFLELVVVHWFKGVKDPDTGVYPGWSFDPTFPGCDADPMYGSKYLSEIYFKCEPNYKGKFSVPLLFDRKTEQIVNNESADLLRMFSTCFDTELPLEKRQLTFHPEHLRSRIDELTPKMQNGINTGVCKCGFAENQEQYDKNIGPLFASLDEMEGLMCRSEGDYLLGKDLTELDVRLYTTLIRFDIVYYIHFKCSMKSIRHDYPHLHAWLKRLYWTNDAFKSTTDFKHIKLNYYLSHKDQNPKGIVPAGPIPIEPL